MNDRVTAGESASAGSAVTSRDGAGGRRSDEARGGRGASAISGRRWRSSPSGAGSGGSALEGSKSSRRARERELAYAPGRGIRASTRLDAEVDGTPEASAPTRRAPLRARYDPRERLAARVVVDPRATSDTPRRKAPPRTNATTASRENRNASIPRGGFAADAETRRAPRVGHLILTNDTSIRAPIAADERLDAAVGEESPPPRFPLVGRPASPKNVFFFSSFFFVVRPRAEPSSSSRASVRVRSAPVG